MAQQGGPQNILDIYDKNQEATIYVGNIDQKIDEDILWELFVQCGPLQGVNCPKDKITQIHMG
jgi:splicing factor 3B subunit 4